MRSIFKTTLLSVLLLTSSNAKDLLDLATNGAINQGDVKILNNNEMKNIKGGYLTQFSILTNTQTVKEIAVIALPDPHTEIGMGFDANGNIAYVSDYGLCGLGVTNCYYNETTKTHLQQNKNRFEEYAKALQWVKENPEEAGKLAKEKLGMDAEVIKKSIPKMGLNFVHAQDAKKTLNEYYKIMKDYDPKNIGGKVPDENLYLNK